MILLSNSKIVQLSAPGELIDAIAAAFALPFVSPDRMHCNLPGDDQAKLLVMPAWQDRSALGVKIATVVPGNPTKGLPTINGVYVLFDGETGAVCAILEAPALTALRTAAVSALASRHLSRSNSRRLLVIGTGALAPHLARAHAVVRKLEGVAIWGRSLAKAKATAEALADLECEVRCVSDLAAAVAGADIISCATSSTEPLIQDDWINPGTHLDLVGSFAPAMREADPRVFKRARLIIDTTTALTESGDLIAPAREGWIAKPVTELADLVRGTKPGRSGPSEVTIFKSVGTGLSDIAAARYFLSKASTEVEGGKLELPDALQGIGP